MAHKRTDDCLQKALEAWLGHRCPHFVKKYNRRWVFYFQRWAHRRGYHTIVTLHNRRAVLHSSDVPTYIEIGQTRSGTYHAVLKRNHRYVCEGNNPLVRITGTIFIFKKTGQCP